MNEFLKYWFNGFGKGLDNLSKDDQCKLLSECGKACSESFTKKLYMDIWDRTNNISDFFKELNKEIPEIAVNEIENNKAYEIRYGKCLCDLYTSGCVNTGSLCECSRQSLLYNLKNILLDNEIKVALIDSILMGGKECVLRVYI